ncbi:coiled-coil domain-containing protein 137 [Sitophilus oryzae]|uniref:Coiled-coil domain-containing protein 137 n=1 Tax=Sitophilus oryzae TaxID=7048 RepID=A0A6J2X273_SITOR|nr:coiled-coil domain-containing protein 137 [Sitophilus oryzae]
MGRKIPGRKHRGVKDPEKQNAESNEKIKNKINAPPTDPDDQQVSKSLLRIIELKKKVKEGQYQKKKKKVQGKDGNNKSNFKNKPIPRFQQLNGETDREFKHRINRICDNVIKEAAFEDKFNVDIKRNEKGQVESVEKRKPDELEMFYKQVRKEKKQKKTKKKKTDKNEEVRLSKSQKWALKKAKKKEDKLFEKENDQVFVPQKEQVKFGEVAHAPPTLIKPKKGDSHEGAFRPGQKSLLLKNLFKNGPNTNDGKNKTHKADYPKAVKTIDKKGKRKHLPNALRRQLDNQQKEIVEAYKMLKAKK